MQLTCPRCGSGDWKKFGTYQHNRGKAQRYRCNPCGRLFATNKQGNRIHPDREHEVRKLLLSGKSLEVVSRLSGVDRNTVWRYRKIYKIPLRRRGHGSNKTHQRLEYEGRYARTKQKEMNSYQRGVWRQQVRERTALLLAHAKRPLTLSEIFERLIRRNLFRELRKCALAYMLNYNADHWFAQIGSYWTYHPSFLWLGDYNNPNNRNNIRLRARRAWFKKYGMEDKELGVAVKSLSEREDAAAIRERVRVFANTQHVFELLAAGAQLTSAMKGIADGSISNKQEAGD